MRRFTKDRAIIFAIAALGLVVSINLYSQQSPASGSKATVKAAGEVHSIVLPQYPPEILQGPNVETYRANCLICHTARYVSMQPRFSKTVWQNEVKKMVDVYGAPVSEADQALIVKYLVAVKGADAPLTPSAPAAQK